MDMPLAALRVGLFDQLFLPAGPLLLHFAQEAIVRFGRHLCQEACDSWTARADDGLGNRQASADRKTTLVDLNDLSLLRQELAVRVVASDHYQKITGVHGVVTGLGPNEA